MFHNIIHLRKKIHSKLKHDSVGNYPKLKKKEIFRGMCFIKYSYMLIARKIKLH